MSNLATTVVEAAERYPQRPAVRLDERFLSYAELDEFSARVAGGLLAHGVRPGDRVGIRLPDVPVFPVLYFGALRTGAVVVAMRHRPWSLAALPRGSGCGARIVFTTPDAMRAGEADMGDSTFVPVGPDFLDQVAFWPQHPGVVERADAAPAVIVETEAAADTALTHGALRDNAAVTARALIGEATADDPSGPVPEFFSTGRVYGLNAVVLAGASLPVGRVPESLAACDGSAEAAGSMAVRVGSGR
ncbi:AMP-binding protein [Streptomyces exfoliatus]|uniref:AMP-binding protein n=1 Tax=Streptomyces exfoliatus TaxID=1905 RepID=UPI003C2C2368